MADPLTMANIGAGIATGAEQAPFRTARLREAQARAAMSEQQLSTYQEDAPLRSAQRDTEVAALQAQLYQTNAALAKQQTYDSFNRYNVDGDPKHLNQWLEQSKSNPVAKNLTADMARMDRLARTPETEKLVRAAGITDIDGFFSDPQLTKNYVIGTMANGGQQLVDMNRMYAVTGYAQQATDEQLKNLTKNAAVIGQLRQGANLRGIQADSAIVGQLSAATGMDRAEVYKMLQPDPVAGLDYVPKTARASGGGGGGSMLERIANQLRAQDPEMTLRDSLQQALELTSRGGKGGNTAEERYVSDYMTNNPEATREEALTNYRQAGRDSRTAGIKNIEYSEQAAEDLDSAFGGDFLNADLNNMTPEQQRVVTRNINRIEQVGGLELTPEEKKNARAIRKLLPTANTAATKLTDDQTGLIDSTLRQVKSYVSNNVPGKDGTIAYENLRALGRNALFGSQVSASDYKAFNKAVASLGEQTGPVLASMKQQMQLMRDDIAAAADLGDPYVAKVRYGTTLEGLDKIVNGLDERISLIQRGQTEGPAGGKTSSGIKVNVTPTPGGGQPAASVSGERPALEDIFGGKQ